MITKYASQFFKAGYGPESQELIITSLFFSQSFMNVRNKACRDHSCVKVSPQENWWDGNHFKMLLSASNKMIQCNFSKEKVNGCLYQTKR